MLLDTQNNFSTNQAVTGTANSTNVIDLSIARDLGPGDNIDFGVLCTAAAAAAGAATVVFALVTADSADLATNPVVLESTDAIGKANITAGTWFLRGSVPISRLGPKRYLGVTYTVATGPLTAGTFTAGLFLDQQANIQYASGLNTAGF